MRGISPYILIITRLTHSPDICRHRLMYKLSCRSGSLHIANSHTNVMLLFHLSDTLRTIGLISPYCRIMPKPLKINKYLRQDQQEANFCLSQTELLQCRHLVTALNAWTVRPYYTTALPYNFLGMDANIG